MFARSVLTCLVLVSACCAGASLAAAEEDKLTITKDVWTAYGKYKDWVGTGGQGFFAVSEDGGAAAGAGCPDDSCEAGPKVQSDAIKECEGYADGKHCVIFGHNQDILVPYEIAE